VHGKHSEHPSNALQPEDTCNAIETTNILAT